MGVHKIRYIVRPASACPADLISGNGPSGQREVDTDFVAACAMAEIFQTGGGSSRALALLFEELLVPGGDKLIWKGNGPGRGKEMRRAFSGLFGRFFARAYLARYHDFAWFTPIDGEPTNISKRMRVARLPGKGMELLDWVCGSASSRIAVAEAKGTSQPSNGTGAGLPGPIKTADGQLKGVVVEKLRKVAGKERWTAVRTKGCAVMSRWGVEVPDAFFYVGSGNPRRASIGARAGRNGPGYRSRRPCRLPSRGHGVQRAGVAAIGRARRGRRSPSGGSVSRVRW
jgi:hypothetical protein